MEFNFNNLKYSVFEKAFVDHLILGKVNYLKDEILINKTLPNKKKVITFIHEFLHILDERYELELTHKQIKILSTLVYELILLKSNIFSLFRKD